jgi:hypothetical protein
MAVESSESMIELIKFAGGPTAVAVLGWWLRGQFVFIADESKKRMASHEKQDDRRHQENLVRFAKINMKLGIDDENENSNGRYGEN